MYISFVGNTLWFTFQLNLIRVLGTQHRLPFCRVLRMCVCLFLWLCAIRDCYYTDMLILKLLLSSLYCGKKSTDINSLYVVNGQWKLKSAFTNIIRKCQGLWSLVSVFLLTIRLWAPEREGLDHFMLSCGSLLNITVNQKVIVIVNWRTFDVDKLSKSNSIKIQFAVLILLQQSLFCLWVKCNLFDAWWIFRHRRRRIEAAEIVVFHLLSPALTPWLTKSIYFIWCVSSLKLSVLRCLAECWMGSSRLVRTRWP